MPNFFPTTASTSVGYEIASIVEVSTRTNGLQNIRQPLPDGEELEEVRLTEREMQVLQQLVEGKSNTEIGVELGVSANTIKGQLSFQTLATVGLDRH